MAEASKAAELSSQPTKRGRKAWLIALAVVVAVATIALLANAPKSEPVKVWFVRATNEGGVKRLVFEGTNGIPGCVNVSFYVGAGAKPDEKAISYMELSPNETSITVPAAETFSFFLPAPTNDTPYYVAGRSRALLDVDTRSGRLRFRCFMFFCEHNMPRVADHFLATAYYYYIPSTSIKE